jgi:transposase-like protein
MAKRGRPSLFKEEYTDLARQMCQAGATDYEIASEFGVDVRTLYRWKNENAEFCQALKAGKEPADDRVERSLFERATGYTFKSEKLFHYQGVVVRAETLEHIAPDVTAQIFWLKNRRPDVWRDTHRHEHDVAPELGERLNAAFQRINKPEEG